VRTLFFLGGASLLSGLEARAAFHVSAADAYLLASPRLMAHGVEVARYAAVDVVDTKSRGGNPVVHGAAMFARIAQFIARHGPFARVVLADLTTPMRMAALLAAPADVVVVDDGLATLTYAAARQRRARTVLDPPRVTFFTAFDVEGGVDDTVQTHRYPHLRARASAAAPRREAWIVGQPLADNGMLTDADYARVVRAAGDAVRARADVDDISVLYVAHPNETDARAATFARHADAEVVRFGRPLELEVLGGRVPRAVVGFFSAALAQLALLVPERVAVHVVRVPRDALLRSVDVVDACYDELQTIGRHTSLTMATPVTLSTQTSTEGP
jgi:hypothetical protein